jgi:hypothetical protein
MTGAAPQAAAPGAQAVPSVPALPGASPSASAATPAASPVASGVSALPAVPSGAAAGAPAIAPGATTGPAVPPGAQPAAAGSGAVVSPDDPAACRGFSFDGLKYSPGGDVLPNKCMPFHPTTNNPYAVRCTDAWPWYKTKFPGDNFCILPPPPDKGIQYGVHPQGKKWFEQVSAGDLSGYDNVSAAWILKEGGEEEKNYETTADTTEPKNFYRAYVRMRPGSHHMIINATENATGTHETWVQGSPAGLFAGTSLPGAQRPDENAPKSIGKPMEDDGLYSTLPAKPLITFDMHHFNATSSVILKEAWVNLWWEQDARVQTKGILGLELTQTATLSVPPGTTQDLHYSWDITQPIRLVSAFGHRHAWTTNFSTWIENPDGKLDIVYQSFNWLDEPTYRYDSETKNPVPAPDKRSDGATSGVLMLQPGQKLHFNCHIEYTDERAKSEKAPSPTSIGTLHFANEAFTAEMCILFGSTAAVQLPTPAIDGTKLPDFATLD